MAEVTERRARLLNGTRSVAVRVATAAGGRGGAVAILLLLALGFFIATPDFLTVDNTRNVLRQYSVPAILAVGQTLVIVSAGIDLSVASTAALSGSLMGVAFAHWGWPGPVAVLLGLAAGFAVGAFNGFVITRLRVPDFIATLGTVAAVCALLGWFVLARTKLGRSAYAIGGNREAARVSGIRIERSKWWIYVISGLLAAVAGMMLAGRLASANALMADGMELQSIAAVVVGGTNLFGGEGGVGGTMIGILIIGVLANGLNILGVADFWQRVVNGLIIVAVVALDQWRRRAARARAS